VNLLKETQEILKRYKLKPRDKLGQNFIIDEGIIERLVTRAEISSADVVFEIGAGIGTLTKHLIEKAKKVYVVEKDPSMAKILRDRFKDYENLEIVIDDVLDIKLPSFDKTVSNIPYIISSPITFKLLRHGFKKAIITYQKEFAERMIAKPGTRDYSRLSIATYYYANARILEILPPEAFYPRPKVYSAIIELVPKKAPFEVDEEFFFDVLRGLFIHRKKTVKKALFHSLDRIYSNKLMKDEKQGIIKKTLPTPLLEKRVFQLHPGEIAEMSNILKRVNM
jgi:16S rRNA (adenine1518-N6/adenine1519-N6)-dimethyltransferase